MKRILFVYLLFPISVFSQGVGFPPPSNPMTGGTAGQVLTKNSSSNYDWVWSTPTGGGDLLSTNNLSDVANAATSRTNLGLGNVNNTSDANKPVSSATQTALDGKQNTGNYLLNTSTSDIGTTPTASSTVTITHNLGRVPTIIRIYGYGTFTSNAAATATTSSMGVWNSSGNRCVYQRYGAAITTTQAGLTSNTFCILLATGGGSFISGVIQNVTSTQFDIIWSETGTSSAQAYLWEAQEP